MSQIKLQILIFIITLSLISWSCAKEDINIDITSSTWEVVKIKNQGESSYSRAKDDYILKFENDSTYTLELDVNSCFGTYKILDNGSIEISGLGCTYICCDNEYSDKLSQLIPKMTSYFGKGKELILEGEGEIVLKSK